MGIRTRSDEERKAIALEYQRHLDRGEAADIFFGSFTINYLLNDEEE